MKIPELEQNSAPLVEHEPTPPVIELFNERKIETVAFDIDGTVLDTPSHFRKILFSLGLETVNNHLHDIEDLPSSQIALDLEKEVYRVYYANNKRPELLGSQYKQALEKYLSPSDFRNSKGLDALIKKYENICYTTSPEAYEKTLRILTMLDHWNIYTIFNSHAEDPWTGKKVNYMGNLFNPKKLYQYVTTPITRKKDKDSWIESARRANSKPENCMATGDNLEADILGAIDAGYKNVTWINRYIENYEEFLSQHISFDELRERDIYFFMIRNIGEIEYLTVKDRILF